MGIESTLKTDTPSGFSGAGVELLELSREDCLELLSANSFGRLAVNGGSGTPIVRPVNYVFDVRSQSVAFRTTAGSKLHSLIGAARAVFEIDGVDPPTRTGWSVIIAGVTEKVSNPAELRRLEGLGLQSWPLGERSHWVRIRARTVSGRRIGEVKSSSGG